MAWTEGVHNTVVLSIPKCSAWQALTICTLEVV